MPCCWHPTLGVDCACYLLVACHLSVAAECPHAFVFILACWVQPGGPYLFVYLATRCRSLVVAVCAVPTVPLLV